MHYASLSQGMESVPCIFLGIMWHRGLLTRYWRREMAKKGIIECHRENNFRKQLPETLGLGGGQSDSRSLKVTSKEGFRCGPIGAKNAEGRKGCTEYATGENSIWLHVGSVSFIFFKKIFCIYPAALVTCGIFVQHVGSFRCGMWALVSWPGGGAQAPRTGGAEP